MTNQTPSTVSELYPSRWLNANDLDGRSFVVDIQAVTLEELYSRQTKKKELKAVLDFGRTKRFALNPTQCRAVAAVVQDERFASWPGAQITIAPGMSHNRKPTIIISPAPAPQETAVVDFEEE